MLNNTLENDFEYQAEEILLECLKNHKLNVEEDIENFQDEIWKENFAKEIGRKFMEKVVEYSGEEIFLKVMKKIKFL